MNGNFPGQGSNNPRGNLPRFQLFPNLSGFTRLTAPGQQPRPQLNPQNVNTTTPSTAPHPVPTSGAATTNNISATIEPTTADPTTKETSASTSSQTVTKETNEDVHCEKASSTQTKDEPSKPNDSKPQPTVSSPGTDTQAFKHSLHPIGAKKVEGNKQPGISVIHMDPYINCLPDYYVKLFGETILPNYCLADKAKCLKQVKEEFKNDRIFLLSSGTFAREIVPEIHALPQLHAIYILCGDVAGNRQWSMQYDKVRVVAFEEGRDRFPYFAIDLAQTYEDFGDYQMGVGRKDRAKARYENARTILGQISVYNQEFSCRIQKKIAEAS